MPAITVVKSKHNDVVAEGDGDSPYFDRVRVYGKDASGGWAEILYWDSAEWREEVNGAFEAILGVIARVASGVEVFPPANGDTTFRCTCSWVGGDPDVSSSGRPTCPACWAQDHKRVTVHPQ